MTDGIWRPSASVEVMRARADMLARIRKFFTQRPTMEVDTPALSTAGVTDPNIHSFEIYIGNNRRLLHTSPEFPMKRLLAAGLGDIYQIAKVFRDSEQGRVHNPEFTMLEWYRLGIDHNALMLEVDDLITPFLPQKRPRSSIKISYSEAIEKVTSFKIEDLTIMAIEAIFRNVGFIPPQSMGTNKDTWLDLLLTVLIAPGFHKDRFTFLFDYPVSQAALAKIRPSTPPVAERFEVYYGELEIANGFHELQDAKEQLDRFKAESAIRKKNKLADIPIDINLIDALNCGLPSCSGVAVGLDRLLMVNCDKSSIGEVLSFSYDRA